MASRWVLMGILMLTGCQTATVYNSPESQLKASGVPANWVTEQFAKSDVPSSRRIPAAEAQIGPLGELYSRLIPESAGWQWQVWELPGSAQLPAGKPVGQYYNTHLLVGTLEGKVQGYLRPIDTTTGCTSGCSPVVFHLRYDGLKQLQGLLTEPNMPLQKVYHQRLTSQEVQHLESLLRKMPEAVSWINQPTDLADTATVFPPKTWTPASPMVVSGGAYTSYRVLQAGLTTMQALGQVDIQSDVSALNNLKRKLGRASQASAFAKLVDNLVTDISRPQASLFLRQSGLQLLGQITNFGKRNLRFIRWAGRLGGLSPSAIRAWLARSP